MPLTSMTVITLTGRFLKYDGSAAQGKVKFTPAAFIVNDVANEIVVPTTFEAVLGPTGSISIQLPATNDPDFEPINFTYQVTEDLTGVSSRTYNIQLDKDAAGATLDLADLVPVGASGGVILVPTWPAAKDEGTAFMTEVKTFDLYGFTLTNLTGGILKIEAPTGLPPSGAAGGVLSGTYPDPGFAVDMATQAELNSHASDPDPHTGYQKESEKNVANGYAGLDSAGLLATAVLPPLSITDTFVVASQAAMLALTAQRGDVAVRTDLTPTGFFLLTSDSPGTLADWKQITSPGAVTSVDGAVGAVNLTATYVAKSTLTTKGDSYWATAASTPARVAVGADGQQMIADSASTPGVKWATPTRTLWVAVLDGGGSVLTTGEKATDCWVPYDCSIVSAVALAPNESGSCTVDVWAVPRSTHYPPVVGDKISATAPVTLASARSSEDTTLTGWTRNLSAGSVVRVNLASVTSLTKLYVLLTVKPR